MKKIIRLYQILLSPLFPASCRFFPTCSEYYFLAIKKHGQIKGFLLFLKRILKCHPFNKGGIDLP